MQWFKDFKTAYKLGLGFGLAVLLTSILGLTCLLQMAQMNGNAKLLKEDSVDGLSGVVDIVKNVRQFRSDEYRFALEPDASKLDEIDAEMKDDLAAVEKAMKAYDATISIPEDRANFNELKAKWDAYLPNHPELIKYGRAMDFKGAARYMDKTRPLNQAVTAQIDKITDWNTKHGEMLANQTAASYSSSRQTVIGIILVSVLVSIGIAWFITRLITSTLKQVSERLNTLRHKDITSLSNSITALAEGDLTVRVVSDTEPLAISSPTPNRSLFIPGMSWARWRRTSML